MRRHANAALTPKGRALIAKRVLEQGWTLARAASSAGVSEPTATKWLRRFQSEGVAGSDEHNSRPHKIRAINAPADQSLQDIVLALLTVPPANHGLNRTS